MNPYGYRGPRDTKGRFTNFKVEPVQSRFKVDFDWTSFFVGLSAVALTIWIGILIGIWWRI